METELRSAFKDYLHVYLTKRDLKAVVEHFHPEITSYGTGADEQGFSQADTVALFARDLSQCSLPIEWHCVDEHVQALTEEMGLVLAELKLVAPLTLGLVSFDNLRCTTVWKKQNKRWLLCHMHLSQAQGNLAPGEAFPFQELEDRTQKLEALVQERTKELTAALTKLEEAVATDPLTGLYNRRKFDELLQREMERMRRFGKTATIILGDIDYFKEVNDQYGHLVGDEILRLVSRVLAKGLRRVDTIARWGGEEFIFLLPETDGTGAFKVAEKLRLLVQNQENSYGALLSMSFGVAEYRQEEDADSWLRRVDAALYQAKRQGRNRVEIE
nr:diguanylate cyclase [uncultured Anaeromusa sp.]